MVEDTVREMVRDAAGPPKEGGHRYSEQIAEAARLVAAELGMTEYDVVWQSRSGPPQVPWLEPDILAHIEALHAAGVPAVIAAPIGFVSDHVEVIWDLDNEAADRAAELGMGFARATTAGADPRFADMMVELIAEHVDGVPQRGIGSVSRAGCTVNGEPCAVNCCAPARRSGRLIGYGWVSTNRRASPQSATRRRSRTGGSRRAAPGGPGKRPRRFPSERCTRRSGSSPRPN
jgi:ferrochelatase